MYLLKFADIFKAAAQAAALSWSGRRDSNPHISRHENLNLACLPITSRPHVTGGTTAGLMKASVRIKRTWQRRIVSNYRLRSQSPLHYRYATALYKSSRAEFKAIPGYVKKGGGLSTITGRRIIFCCLIWSRRRVSISRFRFGRPVF